MLRKISPYTAVTFSKVNKIRFAGVLPVYPGYSGAAPL